MSISSPLIGASVAQIWKPYSTVGSVSDKFAPFGLGTTVLCTPAAGGRDIAKFCRVAAAGVTSAGNVGIGTDGVSAATATNNTWTNETGIALVEGDYAFLTSRILATP